MSMHKFRAALDNLIADTTARSNGSYRRRGKRARKNMAVRYRNMEWDSWDEVPPQIQERILADEPAPPPRRGRRASPPVGDAPRRRRRAAAPKKKPARSKKREHKAPTRSLDPVSSRKAKIIGKSVGGLRVVAPELVGKKVEGGAYAAAFRSVGLDEGRAHRILDDMDAQGVISYGPATPENAAVARGILARWGIDLPLGARPARTNRKRRNKRRSR